MFRPFVILCLLVLIGGCARQRQAYPPAQAQRPNDEIVVAGERFATGARVVLWSDPGGYSAYRETSHFPHNPPREPAKRYDTRFARGGLAPELLSQVREEGWTLPDLQRHVDQFVLHYDVCGTSARCFDVLHDQRHLSVHFMIDLDGTIYQTMDVQERAWHATNANDRSVGVEIANMGAYSAREQDPFDDWYSQDSRGTYITIPPALEARYGPRGGVRYASEWPPRPARDGMITGEIHGMLLRQFDLTPQQYEALIRLSAALHRALPAIRLDYPRGPDGRVLDRTLNEGEFARFQGILGHWHVQQNKVDPGPALDWDRLINGARSAYEQSSP